MFSIRKNVFETNSSSSHSIAYYKSSVGIDQTIEQDYLGNTEGELHITLGRFGWAWETLDTAYRKLQYLLTNLACKLDCNIWYDDVSEEDIENMRDTLYSSWEFQQLLYYVRKNTNFTDIMVDDLEGYVDHDSLRSIEDLVTMAGCDYMEDFIFSSSVRIRTGNDNESDPDLPRRKF
jgi:hypothetical protein